MGDTGLEPMPMALSETAISQTQRAKSGALDDKIDTDLGQIIAVWPNLSVHIKAAIKALVQTHAKESD